MSNAHHLYSFRRCPYAMRVRMALSYANINVTIQDIELKNKPAKMLELSPKGSVPVLVLNNSTIIDESLDIMLWALNQSDPDGWLENSEQSLNLIRQNDGDFKKNLDRYKYPNRYPDEDCSDAKNNATEFLTVLNNHLDKHKFLNGDQITLADIALFPFVRQCAHVDKDWFYNQPWKPLISWLDENLSSPLFQKIMDKNLQQLP